ncbi:hypothetical protein EV401DRAFT_1896269, partial [Pisolithus croceorrhizus]
MSSPRKQTKHTDDVSVDSVVIANIINFLSGLLLNLLTADAVILEIQAWAHPSSFGTPLPLPVTFPVSPHSSCDSPSPWVQKTYPSINTPALSPLTPFKAIHMVNKEPAASTHGHLAPQATSTKVHAKPIAVLVSVSSAFTTTFGIDHILSSDFTCFELVPESLELLSLVGCPRLPTFILEMARGEKCWQQHRKGVYSSVPGPGVAGPYYLVIKGTWIGILSTCIMNRLCIPATMYLCMLPLFKQGYHQHSGTSQEAKICQACHYVLHLRNGPPKLAYVYAKPCIPLSLANTRLPSTLILSAWDNSDYQMMASNPNERWSSTLEQSMEVDLFPEADNTSSTLSTDDYIQVQLPKQVTPPPASKETCTDDDPFLSQLNSQLFCGTTAAVTNGSPGPSKGTPQQQSVNVSALRVSMEEPAVKCLSSLSKGAGSHSSVPLLFWDTKPGLALSALLDKLGFELAGYLVATLPPVTKTILSIKVVPLMLKPPSHANSPSLSRTPSSSLIILQDFFNIEETDISNDKGDQASVVGRVPDSVVAVLMEGFNKINEMFSKL